MSNITKLHSTVNYTTHHASLHNNSKTSDITSPTHIQLPLRRPKNQPCKLPILTQPVKPINNDKNNNTTNKKIKTFKPKCTTTDILHLMDSLCFPIPDDIYLTLIKECTITRDSLGATQLQSHLNKTHLKLSLHFINRLLVMHLSCGHVDTARQLFDQMTVKRDFNSWVTVIIAYLSNSKFKEALQLFVEMLNNVNQHLLLEFHTWFIAWIIKACGHTMNAQLGMQVHALLLKLGKIDWKLSSSLIEFYSKMGCLEGINFVFDRFPQRNTGIWMAKMVSNCREARFVEVLRDYKEMGKAGIRWNSVTFLSALSACAGIVDGAICGRQVHVNAIKLGLECDVSVQCGLIDMYGKCGIVGDATRVFKMIDDKRNVAYWNAMLLVYEQNGFFVEALKLMYRMKAAGIEVHESRINEVRIACGTCLPENVTELCS